MDRKRKKSTSQGDGASPLSNPRYTPAVAVSDVVAFLHSKGHETAADDVQAEFGSQESPPPVTESDEAPHKEAPTAAGPRGRSRHALTLPARPCALIKDYVAFTNEALRAAVKEYLADQATAERRHGKIDTWDVSRVTDMSKLFRGSEFNDAIGSWDTSSVTNMSAMFSGCSQFNQDLSRWDTSSVTNMNHLFNYAHRMAHDISSWDVRAARSYTAALMGAHALCESHRPVLGNRPRQVLGSRAPPGGPVAVAGPSRGPRRAARRGAPAR